MKKGRERKRVKKGANVVKQQQLGPGTATPTNPLQLALLLSSLSPLGIYSIALEWQVLMYLANVSFKFYSLPAPLGMNCNAS